MLELTGKVGSMSKKIIPDPRHCGIVWFASLPVGVDKAERSVVNGEGEDGHVVGVEDPVRETHGVPAGDQLGGLLADLSKHGHVRILEISIFHLFYGQVCR